MPLDAGPHRSANLLRVRAMHEWLFSIAFRAKPRGAARACSHSCNVRFEICHFKARLALREIIPLAPRAQSPWKRTGCEPLIRNGIGERPESHLEMLYGNHV